jgi:hypothetical protein
MKGQRILAVTSNASRLRQVGEDREVPDPQPASAPSQAGAHALSLILLAVQALSNRALVAIGNLVSAAILLSVWWLFDAAIPVNPSVNQLVGLGLYGVFALAVVWMRRA